MNPRFARPVVRSIWQLVLFAVMLTLVSSGGAVWQCEGEICGHTPSVCCCDSPASGEGADCDPRQDSDHLHSGIHRGEVEDSPPDCHCTMTWSGDGLNLPQQNGQLNRSQTEDH